MKLSMQSRPINELLLLSSKAYNSRSLKLLLIVVQSRFGYNECAKGDGQNDDNGFIIYTHLTYLISITSARVS
ncbi:hypothetical protein HanRHA438_Chr16g0757871 [Helianthus annuus]|nr:hypothetical protein HanRHA438_Chr16g0757871 [Helianthus annuus]